MKHSLRIIAWLVLFFLLSQIIGLFVVSNYIKIEQVTKIDLTTNKTYEINETIAVDLPNNMQRPEFQDSLSLITYLIITILLATILFLFLVKLKTYFIWKLWFFFAVFLCLTVSLASFDFINPIVATIIGFILAGFKILRPSILIHNLTELFIYGGLAAILVPIEVVNELTIIILLLIISVYDAYSVWKSKHMIKMAKFQAQSKVFAGLLVPYKKESKEKTKIVSSKKKSSKKGKVTYKGVKTAILGGGDVAFPLLFAGSILKSLVLTNTFAIAFAKTLIVPITTAFALFLLFVNGREDRFYPALPFLTVGCLIGYGIILLINLI
jgi:presenilin-like A22 family membrane protease